MPFSIKLSRPINPQRIPSFETVLQGGRQVMSDAQSWAEGKTYVHPNPFPDAADRPITVRTFSRKIPTGPPWFMRVTRHPPSEGTFMEFWSVLGVNHSINEADYVPEITRSTMIQAIEPGVMEIWTIHYGLSAPFSPRTFSVLILTHLETITPRQGWIISVPFNTTGDEAMMAMEEKGVRGKYAAIERLREVEDGTVEWSLATTTTVGGLIPDWFTARAIPSAIAEDCVQFLAWFRDRRANQPSSKIKDKDRAKDTSATRASTSRSQP